VLCCIIWISDIFLVVLNIRNAIATAAVGRIIPILTRVMDILSIRRNAIATAAVGRIIRFSINPVVVVVLTAMPSPPTSPP